MSHISHKLIYANTWLMVTSPPPNTYLHMHIPHGLLTFLQHLVKEQPHSAVED